MADAALPSIGVVTTLQNKVGTSLSGITSLLTPKEQTSAMVQAGASAMSTSVLLGIKNDTEKTLYQTTRTADILSDQLDLQEFSERKAREDAAEALKEAKGRQGTGTPIGAPAGVDLDPEDKKGFDFGSLGDIATLGFSAAITKSIMSQGGMKEVGKSLGKKLFRGGLYTIVASAVAGPLVEFVDEEFKLGMEQEFKKDLKNSATGAVAGAALAGLPGAIIGGTIPMIARIHEYMAGGMNAKDLNDGYFAALPFAGAATVYGVGKLGTLMAASKLPMVATLGGAIAATPVLLAVGAGLAAGAAATFLAKKVDEYQERTLDKLKGTVAQIDREMGEWAAKQEESFLENMGIRLGTQSELGKAKIATEEGVEQMNQGRLDDTSAKNLAALATSFTNMNDDALKAIMSDGTKSRTYLRTITELKQLALGGAFGEQGKQIFEKLNTLSDRFQDVVREQVKIDKKSVSSSALRTLDGTYQGQGDSLEKMPALTSAVTEQEDRIVQLEKDLMTAKEDKEKARIEQGDNASLLKYDREIRKLQNSLDGAQRLLKRAEKDRDANLGYSFAQLQKLYEGDPERLMRLVEQSLENDNKKLLKEQKVSTDMKPVRDGANPHVSVVSAPSSVSSVNTASHFYGKKDVKSMAQNDYMVGAAAAGVS